MKVAEKEGSSKGLCVYVCVDRILLFLVCVRGECLQQQAAAGSTAVSIVDGWWCIRTCMARWSRLQFSGAQPDDGPP